MRLDPAIIKHQIDTLIATYPEFSEDETLRADMFEGSTDLIQFMRQIENRRQEVNTKAEALAIQIGTLRERLDRFEDLEKDIRTLELKMLTQAQMKRLELPEATLSVRLGVPKVVVIDEAALPDEFCRIKREPDRARIKQALAELKSVPGATLSNSLDTIAIRVK